MSHKQLTPGMRPLPSPLRRRGAALLHQQCWLWGQDIKCAEGNLLLQYGFDRLRPPADVVGSTQYTLLLPCGNRVRLWGFGLSFGTADGLYLNRFDFTPRAARASDLWQGPQEMAGLPRSADLSRLSAMLEWISRYEAWIAASQGASYRRTTLAGWKLRVSTPTLLARSWSDLAHDLEHRNRAVESYTELQATRWRDRTLPLRRTQLEPRPATAISLR